jgi:hypothetical protein
MGTLYILVADLDIENVVRSLIDRLARKGSISLPDYEIEKHPNSDPGCFAEGASFLMEASVRGRFQHLLIMFDREGCGKENWTAEGIADDLKKRLLQSGWEENRVACIVLDPEVENWIWTESTHTAQAMGWGNDLAGLKKWLREDRKFRFQENGKPERPKEAALAATKEKRVRFNRVHQEIAQNASLERCTDPSFLHFKETLLRWFPADA